MRVYGAILSRSKNDMYLARFRPQGKTFFSWDTPAFGIFRSTWHAAKRLYGTRTTRAAVRLGSLCCNYIFWQDRQSGGLSSNLCECNLVSHEFCQNTIKSCNPPLRGLVGGVTPTRRAVLFGRYQSAFCTVGGPLRPPLAVFLIPGR